MVTHYVRFIETLRCDFGDPDALLRRNALVWCHMDIAIYPTATVICPRRVNDVEYVWHPQPMSYEQVHLKTYVSGDGKFRAVPLSDVIVTEEPRWFVWIESNGLGSDLHLDLMHDDIYAINERRLIFICGPRDLVLSDALQRQLDSLDDVIHMQELPWTPATPLTQEISKIGTGLGLVFLYRDHMQLKLQGCGSRPSPLFAADTEVTIDPVTGTRSCVADPMSKSPIGFLCEGRIEPEDCMTSLYDKDGGVVKPPRPRFYWKFEHHRPWVVAQYFDKLALLPFHGECRCIDPQTGHVKATIEVRSKTDYICDISSLILRNRFLLIRGPWCSVMLHPGNTLTIRFPAKSINSASIKERFDENSDGDIDEHISNIPFSQLPSIYEYETEFLPQDMTTLRQQAYYYDLETYGEISYNKALAGDALELDVSQIARGEVKLKYHIDKPLSSLGGHNVFLYHWTLISKNENVLEKIRSTVNVSFAFNHDYTKVGCDRGQRHVFDQHSSKNYCTNKLMSNDIGSTYECALHFWRAEWKTGIYCSPDEELLPKNCDSTAYDLYSNSIIPLPISVRSVTPYPIQGFQVLNVAIQNTPISYACISVDQRGHETSKLILESYDKLSRNFVVSRITNFNRLLPNLWVPWHTFVLLCEGPTPERFINMQRPSEQSIKLRVGTTLSMTCELALGLQNVGNSGAMKTTWLPTQSDEFHYTVKHTLHGRELIRTSHKDVMTSTKGGLEVVFHEDLIRSGYQTLKIKSHKGAVLISKDPFYNQHVPMRFVCGKAPHLSILSIVNGNRPASDTSEHLIPQITESSEQYNWHVVEVAVETTDPYMQGCGVTQASAELFKPETPPLYDGDGQSQFGCKIDLRAAKEAAFYCPAPYLLDPPNCFSQASADGEVRNLSDLSESLVASRSNHFAILSFDSSLVGVGDTLRQTPPLECRCVTIKGAILSTIQIENYYVK
ncbi:hypothetical protein, conserved [Babesia ovata]|uniref:6-Cys domain-containing protein n=1 Tax=Babesia ovata TaxID=189622 RepID=A0A2H6KGI4_9APIC|nr:uncharacterized protein BOVATA_035840 [Babesia ovata]GBE62091.1 hypothetical protein, conserved [Babesia ovata]